MTSISASAFPLGLYVGNPNGNDAVANALFEANFDAFRALMGGAPSFMNAFTDFSQDPSQWVANAGWTAWSWAQTGAGYVGPSSRIIPVIGIPLASNGGGWANADDFYRAILGGSYDAVYKGIVSAWAGQGYTTIQLRLGYEFDGNFMPWAPGNSSSPTANADFIAAWQHVADLVHAQGVASGIKVETVWNPADINWSATPPAQLYPGDHYVDIVSVDAYSPAYPDDLTNWAGGGTSQASSQTAWAADATNRAHYWQFTDASQYAPTGNGSGWSMQDAIDFAAAHAKPLSLSETGAGNNGTTTGPIDDPAFAQWLAGALAAAQAKGVVIQNVNIWATDQSDGAWGFLNGEKPLEAASWAKYFGPGSGASSVNAILSPGTVVTPVVVTPVIAPVVSVPGSATAATVGTTIDQSHSVASSVAFVSDDSFWLAATAANPVATKIGQNIYWVTGVTTDGNTGVALVTSLPIKIGDNQWGSAVATAAPAQITIAPPTKSAVTLTSGSGPNVASSTSIKTVTAAGTITSNTVVRIGGLLGYADQTLGTSGMIQMDVPSAGAPNYLQSQYIYNGDDNMAFSTQSPNVFIHSGSGTDAIQVNSGQNVLDGGLGSNFLTGGSGTDTFFTDARNPGVAWNTIRNFHAGDAATLWGFTPGVSNYRWESSETGAAGSEGATLRANIVGGAGRTGDSIDASITFTGLSVAQASHLQFATGSQPAGSYLYIYNPGV